MEQVWLVLVAMIPVYGIVGVGALLRKLKALPSEVDKSLMQIVVHVLLPALILSKMIGHPSMKLGGVVVSAMSAGCLLVVVTTLIAFWSGRLLGLKKGSGRRTFGVSVGLQNFGYLAIPLVDFLFPDDGAVAVLFVHNVGVEIALWTLSVMLLTGEFKPNIRVFLKGPIVAVFLGILVNFSGVDKFVPEVGMVMCSMLGRCAIPLALLLIGASLFDLFGKEKMNLKVCFGACVLRLMLFPVLFFAVIYFLPLALPLKQVLVVQSSLPAAMLPIILARYYGGNVGIVIQVVIATSLLSIVTLPLTIYLGIQWFGL